MTDAKTSEHEKSMRRVRRFYQISAQREWERLEHPTQGALEFAINKAWIQKFLPESGARILDIGGGPGRYSIWLAAQGYRVTLADLSPDERAGIFGGTAARIYLSERGRPTC